MNTPHILWMRERIDFTYRPIGLVQQNYGYESLNKFKGWMQQ